MRAKLEEIVKNSPDWDGEVAKLQVTNTKQATIEIRCILGARSAGSAFSLRCEVREKMIDFLQREHPEVLPRQRSEAVMAEAANAQAPKAQVVREAAGGRRG
jgi:hypothetical protein